MLEHIIELLVNFVHSLGYLGLFVATFLESTFVPIPSEVTMVPAGYLAYSGEWNIWVVWCIAITGTISGSVANYAIAYYLGRPFFMRYGKYVAFNEQRMTQMDQYFLSHGEISIFTARFIPGVRHVISFPAGLFRMNLKKFTVLTGLGGGIWMTILMFVGYTIGGNKELVKHYMPYITLACLAAVVSVVVLYIVKLRRRAANGM